MKKTHSPNDRVYSLIGILYEDDENFDNQMFSLMLEHEVIYARHDKDVYLTDVYEDDDETKIKYHAGDLKKPHIHYVVKFKNPCTLSAFAKRIQVKPNSVEYVDKSLNSCITYLIHFKIEDKYQYDSSIVEGNSDTLLSKFHELIDGGISETEKVINIQEFIEKSNDFIDLGVLGKYVQKINMWDAFRRNMMYFCKLVDLHNSRISAIKYNYNNDSAYWDSEYTPSLHNIHSDKN